MKRKLISALLPILTCWGLSANPITVAYPPENAQLSGIDCVYLIGAVPATNGVLTVNGAATEIYRTGAFLRMVRVLPGTNLITINWLTNSLVRRVVVKSAESSKAATRSASAATNKLNAASAPTMLDTYRKLNIPTNAVFAASPPYGKKPDEVLVVVDAGHGGDDPGALSPHGWPEKTANLRQAQAIRDALRRRGFKVAMTREDDSYPQLYARARQAWQLRADAFISVHHNATAANRNPRRARHTVTYASNAKGLKLAEALQKRIAPVMAPVADRGAQLKSLAVCRNPAVASCLLEVDFINLPEGEEIVFHPHHQAKIADAVAQGVEDWMTEK